MSQAIHNLFEKLALFADLSAAERDELIRASRIRNLKKNDFAFHHGAPCSSFFIVAGGAIRVHRETPDGKEVTLNIAIVGDTLGDHEMFENRDSYQSSALATEDSILIEYSTEWIKQKIREHSDLALNMLATISKSSSRLAIDKEHLVTLKTPQRIACFLLRLCALHDFNPSHFVLPYSKITIASKLGMEPESFSRALVKLKEVGVTVNGHDVQIANAPALENYVCSACSIAEDCESCRFHKIADWAEK